MTCRSRPIAKTQTHVWLTRARITDDPEGDLIEDMRSDMRLGVPIPRLFANAEEMHCYLVSRGACSEALACVPRVWRRYRQWMDRNRGARWTHLPHRKGDPDWIEAK